MPTQALLSHKWQRRIPPHPLDVFRDDIAPQHLALLVGLFGLFVFLTPTCETYSTVPIVQFSHLEPVVLCYSPEKVTDRHYWYSRRADALHGEMIWFTHEHDFFLLDSKTILFIPS